VSFAGAKKNELKNNELKNILIDKKTKNRRKKSFHLTKHDIHHTIKYDEEHVNLIHKT
jgi:hypothetical protein